MDPGTEIKTARPTFFDPKLAERLSALTLRARRSMLGTVSGRHQSPHRGSSVEFAEYRRYQPGDDLRRLDWRAYGRSDRYYVKEFEADTNLRLVLVIDGSGSMGFGGKLHAARQIASTLAYIAIQQGDAAGMVCASEADSELLPPRRIAAQVSALLAKLENVTAAGATVLEQTLHQLAETIRERALVVVLSDLLFEPASFRSAVEHFAFRKHDVAVFHLMDPAELQPNWDRPIRLQDMESDESILVDPDEIADRYDAAVRDFVDEIERVARESAVDYHRFVLDQPIEATLMRFLAGRGRDQRP